MWSLVQRLMGPEGLSPSTIDVTDPRFPKAWSVFALLYCCVYSDGEVQAEEDIEVDALVTRTRTFMPVAQEDVDRFVSELDAHMDGANSVLGLADFAIEHLPGEPGLPLSVFAHCVDLVHADRRVQRSEQEFIDHIAEAMKLSQRDYEDVIQVMEWKHEVFSPEAEPPETMDPALPWTRRRCMFVLYYAAALVDRKFTHDEALSLASLIVRAKSLQGLSDEMAEEIREEVMKANSRGQLQLFIDQALRDLPDDERNALAVYANCADIIRADRKIVGAERRYMEHLARNLKLTRPQRDMIDRIMDAKYRH